MDTVDKSRIASFSDNVISIAMTLLVLNVRLPGNLISLTFSQAFELLRPRLMSFLLSFCIVGVYWVAHHVTFRAMHSASRSVLWLNNLILLWISLIPASAAMLGDYPRSPVSTVFYGGNIALVGISMLLLWHYVVQYHRRLGLPLDPNVSRAAYQRTIVGITIALSGAGIGFFSTRVSYAIFWIAPIGYILVQTLPGRSSHLSADSAGEKVSR